MDLFDVWASLFDIKVEVTEKDSLWSPQKWPFRARKSGPCATGDVNLSSELSTLSGPDAEVGA